VLDEAITAITLSSTPTLIIKQRANADTRSAAAGCADIRHHHH